MPFLRKGVYDTSFYEKGVRVEKDLVGLRLFK